MHSTRAGGIVYIHWVPTEIYTMARRETSLWRWGQEGDSISTCHQNAVSVSSGSNVSIVRMLCQCHQGAVLVSSECGVGVVEVQCWYCQNMVLALLRHSVCVIKIQCQYHRDAVLVSSGCGISVIGMCQHHWEAVLVLVLSGDRRPCCGHLRMAHLTVIFEISTRYDVTFLRLQIFIFFTCLLILSHHVTSPIILLSHDHITWPLTYSFTMWFSLAVHVTHTDSYLVARILGLTCESVRLGMTPYFVW